MDPRGSTDGTRRLTLAGTTNVVSRSRDFTREALIAWCWLPDGESAGSDPEAAEDVLLLVSEVVANACLHGRGPRALVLDCSPERLRVEVTDGNPAPPVRIPDRGPDERAQPGGHGLLILERLARGWGSESGADGKSVWFEVPCPPGVCAPAG
ncbi:MULTISPECIES: ATP-binding protein [Streptomyces]|uniref:ATPase n=1 Tax=Streptomyces spororaveus TaxID=284039 RepID=A0ABQ3TQ32_9ACTN|nr:ATP-binding protein [Streptomyces spororaveus]GHI82508.1 ATPase [Streptomyces spororaveus]